MVKLLQLYTLNRLSAAIILSLVVFLALTGCSGVSSAQEIVASPPPPVKIVALPTAIPTEPPTPTPTIVVLTATPTLTPLPSPTFTPTPIPTATQPAPTAGIPTPVSCCQIDHVVIISIDGLRPDALEQADTPTLDALRAAGAYSPAAQAVLPSVTLVNHASMLGGMSPEKHGIDWNVEAPELGKVNGPTIFTVARDYGLTTAMVVGKPKLEHLVLPGSVDNYIYAGFLDVQVVNRAREVIQAGLPHILFVHLPDVDTAGHATGWMSPGQLLVVSTTDGLVGQLVAELEAGQYLSKTLLIITADHGGVEKFHGMDSPEEMTIPWLAVGPGAPAGVTLQANIVIYDTAATALAALQVPIPEMWDGRPVLEIFGEN